MEPLRETLDADGRRAAGVGPTREKTEVNRYPLHCEACAELFYVEELTAERAQAAAEYDPFDSSFLCDECEGEYADEEYGR